MSRFLPKEFLEISSSFFVSVAFYDGMENASNFYRLLLPSSLSGRLIGSVSENEAHEGFQRMATRKNRQKFAFQLPIFLPPK